MKKVYLSLILAGLLLSAYAQKKEVNIITELHKLENINELPRFWPNTTVTQVSSYDTTGMNNDGFGGQYSFIRKTPDGSLVILDEKGNGVINRIWTPTPTTDTLDFYFSGSDKPSYSIRFLDLFSGDVFPFVAPLSGNELGGYYSYFPIPYKNGCKIVLRGKKLQFYQIQTRSFPKKYKVENFSQNRGDEIKSELTNLTQKWEEIGGLSSDKIIHVDDMLAPGQSITLAELPTGGRISAIKLYNAKIFTGITKQIDLKITWDDEQPAVYMPVADFFGYAFGQISMQSILLGTRDNTNYCYFPMPFDTKAKVELIYRVPDSATPSAPLQIVSDVFVNQNKRDPKIEGKFYAYWNREPISTPGKPHVFLDGTGKGHYVGTILQAQGLNPGMTTFFEGDDSTRVDGEMIAHGTGSEDYFNGGWYALMDRWDRNMSLPLHGALEYSLPYARTGGYRLFISDKMPFEKNIYHSIEHGPEKNNVPADYTSVALYYAEGPVEQNQKIPTNDLTRVYTPETFMFYPQLISYSIAGSVRIDGNTLQSEKGGKVRMDLGELPKGHYKLYADLERTPEGAQIQFWQRQKPVGKPVSFYAKESTPSDREFLCDIDITDFIKTITLDFMEDKTGSSVHVNRWILVHQP